jgi:branched-chain amino acid transport system substrate-binding protein
MRKTTKPSRTGLTRRTLMKAGAGTVGGALLPVALTKSVLAADKFPAISTFPEGVSGSTAFIGISAAQTGPYAAQGEDLIKGYQLAVEQINEGHELVRKISPLTKKGVLGKKLIFGVADNQTKPNTAVEAQTRFITENKAIMITGSISSAIAVACNKLAQREKVIYLAGISGSNDTTGKDCVRYGFRASHYAHTAAAAISPVLVKQLGPKRKAAYLTPDYTYGHTVFNSMKEVTEKAGWTTVTNQLAPLGAPDFSSYLLNIANSGADVLINIGFGADAVNSIKQAKQFGLLDKMTMVVPYNTPFLAKQLGADIMQGIYATTEFWWTLGEKNPLAKMFVDTFEAKFKYKPRWSAHIAFLQTVLWADAVERAGTFYPPEVIKSYEKEQKRDTTIGTVWFRAADHQLVRPVFIQRGKKPSEMRNPDDFYEIVETVDGAGIMQPPDAFGCKLGDYT